MEESRQKTLKLVIVFVLAGILILLSLGNLLSTSKDSRHFMGTLIMVMTVILICFVVDSCWQSAESSSSSGRRGSDASTSSFVHAEAASPDPASPTQPPEYEPPPSYEEMEASGQLQPPTGNDKLTANDQPATPTDEANTPTEASEGVGVGREVQLSVEGLPNYDEAVTAIRTDITSVVYIPNLPPQENQDLILFI